MMNKNTHRNYAILHGITTVMHLIVYDTIFIIKKLLLNMHEANISSRLQFTRDILVIHRLLCCTFEFFSYHKTSMVNYFLLFNAIWLIFNSTLIELVKNIQLMIVQYFLLWNIKIPCPVFNQSFYNWV